jgi:long-chain fatty acid transport protein
MSRNQLNWKAVGVILGLLSLSTGPVLAAGFSIFEQGSKAMGLGGAFTAQADDASAIFFNVGGIAFQKERAFQLGATYITTETADYKGLPPYPGSGVNGEQKKLSKLPVHFYWVEPINDSWTFGLGLDTPFGLAVEWDHPNSWPGRFISQKAELQAVDLSVNLGYQATPKLGLGFGIIARTSTVELVAHRAAVNPFTLQPADVARVDLKSDSFNDGYGFQVGMLYKYNNSFQWGLTYRGSIKVDYSGDLTSRQISTGNPVFDAIVATQVPFGQKVGASTSIEFPDTASLGLNFALSPTWRLETDVNWTGWSHFKTLIATFDNPLVDDLVAPQNWEDVYSYRLGVRWMRSQKTEWRFGYVYDENPIPDETLGPLLPDANRTGYSVGYGFQGNRLKTDLALMYLPFDKRTIDSSVAQVNGFYGTYDTTAWLLGVTVGW